MAKAAKTAIKKDPKLAAEAKNYTKVIKAVRSPKTGALLVIDDGMKSRHIANRVLKAAGLPKAF